MAEKHRLLCNLPEGIVESDVYAACIFFGAAVPLLKVVCDSEKKFGDKFIGKSFVFQISAQYPNAKNGKMGTHFVVENGKWTCYALKCHENPDIEFAFPDLRKFNLFFTGKGMPLPKIKGMLKLGKLVPILMALLRMAGLMQAKDKPTKFEDKVMLTKLYFYLLPNGISRLNALGHPFITKTTEVSPDRVYSLMVTGREDLMSWIRMKEGKTASGRGANPLGDPFLSMEFKDPDAALEILMGGDMIKNIANGNLVINGAPEFGDVVGDLMFKVGYYAQGQYFDAEKLL